jgi:hypothetical protein
LRSQLRSFRALLLRKLLPTAEVELPAEWIISAIGIGLRLSETMARRSGSITLFGVTPKSVMTNPFELGRELATNPDRTRTGPCRMAGGKVGFAMSCWSIARNP